MIQRRTPARRVRAIAQVVLFVLFNAGIYLVCVFVETTPILYALCGYFVAYMIISLIASTRSYDRHKIRSTLPSHTASLGIVCFAETVVGGRHTLCSIDQTLEWDGLVHSYIVHSEPPSSPVRTRSNQKQTRRVSYIPRSRFDLDLVGESYVVFINELSTLPGLTNALSYLIEVGPSLPTPPPLTDEELFGKREVPTPVQNDPFCESVVASESTPTSTEQQSPLKKTVVAIRSLQVPSNGRSLAVLKWLTIEQVLLNGVLFPGFEHIFGCTFATMLGTLYHTKTLQMYRFREGDDPGLDLTARLLVDGHKIESSVEFRTMYRASGSLRDVWAERYRTIVGCVCRSKRAGGSAFAPSRTQNQGWSFSSKYKHSLVYVGLYHINIALYRV